MLLSTLVLLLPLAAPVAPAPGIAQQEAVKKMVSANVESLVVEAAAPERTAGVVLAADDTSELGFFDLYFPFSLDDDLHPEVEENVLVVWILMVFLGGYVGPAWIPKVITGLDVDEEYMREAIINWVVHIIIAVVSIPLIYCFGLGAILSLVNSLYLFPVATINSFNRHVEDAGKKKKRRRKSSTDSALALPGLRPLALVDATAAFAY